MTWEGRPHAPAGRAPHGLRPSFRHAAPTVSVRATLAAGLLLVLAGPPGADAAPAERPAQALERVEQEIQADEARRRFLDRQTEALEAETEELRAQLVSVADAARTQERELVELEDTLAALEAEEAERAASLDEQRRQIARLLAALQKLSRVPPEVAIARPGGPVDTLRSALMLREAVPVLRARADTLASALQRLAEVRERLVEQRAQAAAARTALAGRQAELARLVARREALSQQTDEERRSVARHMAALSTQAGDLRQLMDRIESERRATVAAAARQEAERIESERRAREQAEAERRAAQRAEAGRAEAARAEAARADAEREAAERRQADAARQAVATAPGPATAQQAPAKEVASLPGATDLPLSSNPSLGGGLRQPVVGRVVTRYGQADRYGAPSRGLTIRARAGTPVVAPTAGTVMFAGPFRSYGQILIVEHGNGYHSLIAGLGRIDTAVGRTVAAGEPIGLAPDAADDFPELYYELRRHGQPINPQRGIGAPEGKGQG